MSQLSSVLKKLCFLTLLCLTVGFYSSLCPLTTSVSRAPGRGDQTTPSPTLPVPAPPLSAPASASAPHSDPPAQTGNRVTFLVQELTGATSRIGRSLATEADYVLTKLSSFIMHSYLHSRILILAPPTRTTPVYTPSRTINWSNPAPTPGHAWQKRAVFVDIEEPVYIQELAEGLPRNDAPKVQFNSQYLLRLSIYRIYEPLCVSAPLWLAPGLFGTLVGVVVILEALIRLEMLRPTPAIQLRALSQAGFDHQVANTTAPESNGTPPESDPIVVMGIQLVASLVLGNGGREVFSCISSNLLVCRASNVDVWLGGIVGRDLLVLEALRANIGITMAINRASIRTTAYNPKVNNLDAWGIDDTQDYLCSRWSIRIHVPTTVATRTPIHIHGVSLDYRSAMVLMRVIVVPNSTFTVLLFGSPRHLSTKGTEAPPLCRRLLVEWARSADLPIEMPDVSEAIPIKHLTQQPIRLGYEVYRSPSVQAAPASEFRLEHARAGQQQLERVEQDIRVVEEAQTHPNKSEHSESSRKRARRGGRRVREQKERRVMRAETAGDCTPSGEV